MKLLRTRGRLFEFAAIAIVGGVAVLGAWSSVAHAGATQTGGPQGVTTPTSSGMPAIIAPSRTVLAEQAAAANTDPILRAMLAELTRSKDELKMESVARPYYVEYRITDIEQYEGDAEFGSLEISQRWHQRALRAVVRIGDYKQDSYFGQGQGESDSAPVENDGYAFRHALWLATDTAYKAAGEALAAKQAMMKTLTLNENVDDFAHAEPLVAVGPLAKLQFDEPRVTHMLEEASGLYREDPESAAADGLRAICCSERIFCELGRQRDAEKSDALPHGAFRKHASERWNEAGPFAGMAGGDAGRNSD